MNVCVSIVGFVGSISVYIDFVFLLEIGMNMMLLILMFVICVGMIVMFWLVVMRFSIDVFGDMICVVIGMKFCFRYRLMMMCVRLFCL